jgi:uncharacterized membrane protein
MPLAWIELEYLPAWKAALLWAALALPVVGLGVYSLGGLGPVRKWVAIGWRLLVLALLVLILAGARWQRQQEAVHVWVLRDISRSTLLAAGITGTDLRQAVDQYLRQASERQRKEHPDDKIGVISFADVPLTDSMLSPELILDARAVREPGDQTDIARAITQALAQFGGEAMRRILLISDGNQNAGDLERALAAAAAQRVPIDVMPLKYEVTNEVIVERITAPSFKREGDAFDLFVNLLSTNRDRVTGRLEVFQEGQPLAARQVTLEPATVGPDGRLEPRKQVERVRVPALGQSGVLRFRAVFTPDVINSREDLAAGRTQAGDTLLQNNSAGAFTFVQGRGRVLYVDNSVAGSGATLAETLRLAGINLERVGINGLPATPEGLTPYDAIILNNVPRGRSLAGGDGVSDEQSNLLASYVHDLGGGLIMIGGEQSFGAGGWQGSKVEEVMPVSFDVPAQRQMPKGALVMIIHSCEMENGNYWGEQCALKAVETLSSQDDVGVIAFTFAPGKPGLNGASWDYVLGPKGDGIAVNNAIKQMRPGDMPSFDDTLNLALNGTGPGAPGLATANAAQKHIIIISDGDPGPPKRELIQQCLDKKITISTITVYPHTAVVPGTMQEMAKQTGGRYYGPINNNPQQLPQIFIKEATVVRRTLIQESTNPPISVGVQVGVADVIAGIDQAPPIHGLVLSQKKDMPGVVMPMVAVNAEGKTDPLLAIWQAGLGKAAAFASDASARWQSPWLTPDYIGRYGKLWVQLVRAVSRPPMSGDFAVTTQREGDVAKITVEATNKQAGFSNFVRFTATVIDAEGRTHQVRMVQSGPGTYSGEFPAAQAGNYVVALQFATPDGQQGWLASGLSVNESIEMRDLRSNDLLLREIARRTGGRVLPAFDPAAAGLFARDGLAVGISSLPVWEYLIPVLLAMILIDVAIRRIAWSWAATVSLLAKGADFVRSFTLTRSVQSQSTVDALRRVRQDAAQESAEAPTVAANPAPDRTARFEAPTGVEGDITQVVGGATDQPLPPAPREAHPKGAVGDPTGSLLEAKRRAREQIRRKEGKE